MEQESKQQDFQSVIVAYQANFGAITPYVYERITLWCDSHKLKVVMYAMELAIINKHPRWQYIDKLLRNWRTNNLNSLKEIKRFNTK